MDVSFAFYPDAAAGITIVFALWTIGSKVEHDEHPHIPRREYLQRYANVTMGRSCFIQVSTAPKPLPVS